MFRRPAPILSADGDINIAASEPYATVVDQLATGCRHTLANWAAAFHSPAYAFSGVVVDASVVEVASDIAPQSPLGLSGGNALRYTLCCGRQFYTIRLCRLGSKAQGGKHANCGSSNQHFPHGSLLSSGRGAFPTARTSTFTSPISPSSLSTLVYGYLFQGITAVTARAPLTHHRHARHLHHSSAPIRSSAGRACRAGHRADRRLPPCHR